MWEEIGGILNKKIKTSSFKKTFQAAMVCDKASAIGAKYGFEAISFNNSILTIGLENNLLAQQIQSQEKKIIEEINQALKKYLINRLKYKIISAEV